MIESKLVKNAMKLITFAYGDGMDEDEIYRMAIEFLEDDEITETTDRNGRYCLWFSEIYTDCSTVNYLYYPDTDEFEELDDEEIDGYLY